MPLQYPEKEDIKSWFDMDETQRRYALKRIEDDRPYVERILAIGEELAKIRVEMAENRVWDLSVPNYEIDQALNDVGFYDTWLPSAQDC